MCIEISADAEVAMKATAAHSAKICTLAQNSSIMVKHTKWKPTDTVWQQNWYATVRAI